VKKLFWIVTSFAAVSSIGASMILPYIPVYGREVGMSVGLVGYLVFIYYGVEALTRIPVGSLSDVIGHSKVILVGGISLLFAGFSYLFSSEISQLLFVAQLFFGVGISITWVTIPSFVTKMEHSVSKYTFSVGLGWLIGPPIGGFIKDSWGMFVLFWIFFFINVVIVIISILFYIFNDEESEVEMVEVRDGVNYPYHTYASASVWKGLPASTTELADTKSVEVPVSTGATSARPMPKPFLRMFNAEL